MDSLLAPLLAGMTLSGDLSRDVPALLERHGKSALVGHVRQVAARARDIAARVGVDADLAEAAGWLHDVSLVLPAAELATAARHFGLEILPAEEQVPFLLHGKVSAVFARDVFGVVDAGVHCAMRCHTTLRAGASALDQVLFVADKLSWDPQDAPYHAGLVAALDRSLDHAALHFLSWAWQGRDRMPAVHPWLQEAYEHLSAQMGGTAFVR